MPFLTGIIEKVGSKQMDKADDYGNTFRRWLKIEGNDKLIGLGTGKSPEIQIKEGKAWTTLKVGDNVEFVYVVKGEYLNASVKDIKRVVTADVPAETPKAKGNSAPAQNARAAQATGQSSSGLTKTEISIRVGQALNESTTLEASYIAAGEDFNINRVEYNAWELAILAAKMNKQFEERMSQTDLQSSQNENKNVANTVQGAQTAGGTRGSATANGKNAPVTENDDYDDYNDDNPF